MNKIYDKVGNIKFAIGLSMWTPNT